MNARRCTIDGCDRDYFAKGLCSKHYQANRNTTRTPSEAPLEFLVPVTVMMPQRMLARISGVARHHEAEIGPLIVELVRRQLLLGGTAGAHIEPARTGGKSRPAANGRRWDPANNDRIRELHAAGYSDNRIGKELGWNPGTIALHRERLGLPRLFTSLNPKLQRPDPVAAALAEGGGDAA